MAPNQRGLMADLRGPIRQKLAVFLDGVAAGAPQGIGDGRLEVGAKGRLREGFNKALDMQQTVPELQGGELGVLRHRLAVGPRHLAGQAGLLLAIELPLPRHQDDTDEETFDIPLKRSRSRLIKVVDVEDQAALGRGIEAEVQQVGIAAELDPVGTAGQRSQVRRHLGGRPPKPSKGALGHAPMALRDQPGQAGAVLLLNPLDRVQPIDQRLPERQVLPSRVARAHRPADLHLLPT